MVKDGGLAVIGYLTIDECIKRQIDNNEKAMVIEFGALIVG